jgi:hypothetical protein
MGLLVIGVVFKFSQPGGRYPIASHLTGVINPVLGARKAWHPRARGVTIG